MMPASMRPCRSLSALVLVAVAMALGACGSQGNDVATGDESATIKRGAALFVERCAGCHQLDKVGAQGGALKVGDRERVDGPNFNVRGETVDNVVYAIRNGGFSGAIMPENLVVGEDAQAVAEFLAKYAGGARAGGAASPDSQGQQDTP